MRQLRSVHLGFGPWLVDHRLGRHDRRMLTRTSVLAFFAADHLALAPDAKVYVNWASSGFCAFPPSRQCCPPWA